MYAICRHKRGGFHVYPLERVMKMNLDRMMRGEDMSESWFPLATAESLNEGREIEARMKRDLKANRIALSAPSERGPSVPYSESERRNDDEEYTP